MLILADIITKILRCDLPAMTNAENGCYAIYEVVGVMTAKRSVKVSNLGLTAIPGQAGEPGYTMDLLYRTYKNGGGMQATVLTRLHTQILLPLFYRMPLMMH